MTYTVGNVSYMLPEEIQARLTNQLADGLDALQRLQDADINTASSLEAKIIRAQNVCADLILDATMGRQHFRDERDRVSGGMMAEDPKLAAAKADKIASMTGTYIDAANRYNQFKSLVVYLELKFKTFNNACFSVSGAGKRDQTLMQRS